MFQFIYSIATTILAIVMAVVICIFVWLTEPGEMREYYGDKENYVTATGTVTHLASSDDGKTFYLGFSEDLTPEFDDTTFKIVGENVDIVKKNKIWKYVKEGEKVEFEDGYDNLQEWLEE